MTRMWVLSSSERRAVDYDAITSVEVRVTSLSGGKDHYEVVCVTPNDCVTVMETDYKPKVTGVLKEMSRAYMVGKLFWKYGEDV